jgi:hypothetical protein
VNLRPASIATGEEEGQAVGVRGFRGTGDVLVGTAAGVEGEAMLAGAGLRAPAHGAVTSVVRRSDTGI